jgi:hypothetical protein
MSAKHTPGAGQPATRRERDSIREISIVWLGPMAPPRKRPRRVAKRIEARHGRLRFSDFNNPVPISTHFDVDTPQTPPPTSDSHQPQTTGPSMTSLFSFASETGTTDIDWNAGQLITLSSGQRAVCQQLRQGQLYCVYLYNSTGHDQDINVTIVWSGSMPPVTVTVPGTTGNQGMAGLCFVSGNDTNTIRASISASVSGQSIQAWICSVGMPTNTTGITNSKVSYDTRMAYAKLDRYFVVPSSTWYSMTIQSNLNQFISVMFTQSAAVVDVLSKTVGGLNPSQIQYAGPTAQQPGVVTLNQHTQTTYTTQFQGNGMQWVWMSASSEQDANSATLEIDQL